jgi:hypothetical protein
VALFWAAVADRHVLAAGVFGSIILSGDPRTRAVLVSFPAVMGAPGLSSVGV